MAEELLSKISKSDINKFKKDFFEVLKVAAGIDRELNKGIELDKDMKKYKELIKLFNKKYTLNLKIVKTLEEINLKIFFPEKDIREFVKNIASKVQGLVSLGINNFNEAAIAEADKILDKVKDQVCLSYYTPEAGTNNLCFNLNGGIEIHYDKSILEEQNPEFILCAYYALKEGIKEDADIYNLAASFGFVEMLNYDEEKAWLDKFNPTFGE